MQKYDIDQLKMVIDQVNRALPVAEKTGMKLALENHTDAFSEEVSHVLAYLDGEVFNLINGRVLPGEDVAGRVIESKTCFLRPDRPHPKEVENGRKTQLWKLQHARPVRQKSQEPVGTHLALARRLVSGL